MKNKKQIQRFNSPEVDLAPPTRPARPLQAMPVSSVLFYMLGGGLSGHPVAGGVSVGLLCSFILAGNADAQTPSPSQPPGAGAPAVTSSPPPAGVDLSALFVKPTENEVSVSGDYLDGRGYVTVPFGFGLKNSAAPPKFINSFQRSVNSAVRTSDYYGTTVSYSHGQSWFVDFSYERGSDTGPFTLPYSLFLNPSPGSTTPSLYTISENYYQLFFRYTFPSLNGTRWDAYFRGGLTYSDGDLIDIADAVEGHYLQTDHTQDILGNLGLGVDYKVINGRRYKLGLQMEGEGFLGHRYQDDQEVVLGSAPTASASIDNDIYGGLGRGTVHFEYNLGHASPFKAFVDGGMEAKYSEIKYYHVGTFSELLWGPYVKVGIRYSF